MTRSKTATLFELDCILHRAVKLTDRNFAIFPPSDKEGNLLVDETIEYYKQEIIKTIDEQVGKKDYQTNVKAKMTVWEMWDYPGFNKLSTILVKIIKGLGAHKKCSNVKFNIVFTISLQFVNIGL